MSFLPEDDQDYLWSKGFPFEEKKETPPGGSEERRSVVFPTFCFEGNLFELRDGALVRATKCKLLILIPSQYATTKLDSFYTMPHLKRPDGTDPQNANGVTPLFDESWQFWSRHLGDNDWRVGIDGLETYLQYVRAELRRG
jgi:Prokaryotic E2 family E